MKNAKIMIAEGRSISSLKLTVCIRIAIITLFLSHTDAFSFNRVIDVADNRSICASNNRPTQLGMIGNDANDSSNSRNTNVDAAAGNNQNIENKPYMQIAEKEVIGIGGKTGKNSSNYDVNKLKNNLVQKSIRQFKKELLLLLIETESATNMKRSLKIEEKLAALISANPVATTTDSNLLDGTWELAFATSNAVEILDEARFIYSRKKDNVLPQKTEKGDWKLSSNKMDNPLHTFKRSIYLEDLEDDEDPFMYDSIQLFRGIWTVQRFYDIVGVSRSLKIKH
jgi:hypothetical protein